MNLKEIATRIPGVVPAYRSGRRLSFSIAEALGFVRGKDASVSRAYWEQRAIEMWNYDCASADDDTYYRSVDETISQLEQLKWDTLLEVGCGFGRVLRRLRTAFPGRAIVGGDFSFNQVKHAAEYLAGHRIPLTVFDARDLPFPDKRFDIVLTSVMLIYLHPDEVTIALREFKRVGRRYLVLVEYARETLDTLRRRWLLWGASFYGHDVSAALRRVGISVVKATMMHAWANQPRRLPLSLILGELQARS